MDILFLILLIIISNTVIINFSNIQYDLLHEKTKEVYYGFTRAIMLFTPVIYWCAFNTHVDVMGLNEHIRNAVVLYYIPLVFLLIRQELIMRNKYDILKQAGLFSKLMLGIPMLLVIIEFVKGVVLL